MDNILYRPRLSNGKYAPMNWFLQLYRWTNIISWPLEDNVPNWIYLMDRFLWFLGFMSFVLHNDAELRYLRVFWDNLDEMLTGVPTYLVLVELHLRAFSLGLKKNKFKKLLQKFYREIYIEKSVNRALFKKINHQMWPSRLFSLLYSCALGLYIVTALHLIITNKRELTYKMIPPVDYKNNLWIFIFLILDNIWVGCIVATTMFGEGICISLLIFHLNGRYEMMQEKFYAKVDAILKSGLKSNIVERYHAVLLKTLKENLSLNKFGQEIQKEFSFRTFVMFSFSAITLCVLVFKVYTSPSKSLVYMFWAMGKILETLAYGELGSTIITTTDKLSSMYYESKWELIVESSQNSEKNTQLIKLVTLSMVTNQKAFYLTGLNFFNISLSSVVTILQGAGSYFTCLLSLR